MISNRVIEKMGSKKRSYISSDKGSSRQTQKEKAFNQRLEMQSLNDQYQEAEINKFNNKGDQNG